MLLVADACVVIGGGLLVGGVWWNWGSGWALIAAGAGLLWIGWRAYPILAANRAPRKRDEVD